MTEEQNKLAEEIERRGLGRWVAEQGIARLVDAEREILAALRCEPATEAVRDDECWEIIKALDAEGKASSLIGYPVTDTNRPTIRAWLQKRINDRALKGKGASQGQAYTFERYRNGVLMAEGIRVHASNLAEARKKAEKLKDEGDDIRARAPDEQKG